MFAGIGTAEGPQWRSRRTAEGPQGRVGSATPPNIGVPHGSRSLRVIPSVVLGFQHGGSMWRTARGGRPAARGERDADRWRRGEYRRSTHANALVALRRL